MEITAVVDADSHVVLGGAAPQKFEIDDSAEGFHILSDTLYKFKKLACIREVLCNAEDAHIVAGVKEPVEITITDDELKIQDFGPGIADAQMVPVYCTLFRSTKRGDSEEARKQTGGFGLGCKAPFAYTDHFTVTSAHNGVVSHYVAHVGSDETDGAPALRKMGQGVTDKTGITVSIPIASHADRLEFAALAKALVYFGGINAKLNGTLLPTHDIETIKSVGFGMLLKSAGDTDLSRLNISTNTVVLFGNVVYPLENTSEFQDIYRKLSAYVPTGRLLMLYAPPSSVRPVPSREGLSYNKMTLTTIKRLLEEALAKLNNVKTPSINETIAAHFRSFGAVERHALLNLLNKSGSASGGRYGELQKKIALTDPAEILEYRRLHDFLHRAMSLADARRHVLRKVKARRGMLKAALFDKNAAYTSVQSILEADARDYLVRRLIRLGAKTGLINHLYYKNGYFYGSSRPVFSEVYTPLARRPIVGTKWNRHNSYTPSGLHRNYGNEPITEGFSTIRVAWTVPQACAFERNSLVLMRRDLTDEQIDKFVTECKRLNIPVQLAAKPAPVVRPKKAASAKTAAEPAAEWFQRLFFGKYDDAVRSTKGLYRSGYRFKQSLKYIPDPIEPNDRTKGIYLDLNKIEKPDSYLAVPTFVVDGADHAVFTRGWSNMHDRLAPFFPNAVLVFNQKQLDRMEKLNIIRVESGILDLLEAQVKATKKLDVHRLYMRVAKAFSAWSEKHDLNGYHRSDEFAAITRLSHTPQGVRWLFNRIKPAPDEDKIYSLWMLAEAMFRRSRLDLTHFISEKELEEYRRLQKRYHTICREVNPSQYAPSIVDPVAAEMFYGSDKFDDLKHLFPFLAEVDEREFIKKDPELYAELLDFIWKNHRRKQKKEVKHVSCDSNGTDHQQERNHVVPGERDIAGSVSGELENPANPAEDHATDDGERVG